MALKLAWALVASLLASGADAQALRLDTSHERIEVSPEAPLRIGQMPVNLVAGRRALRSISNAIRIGEDRALTVAHCVVKRGWRLRRVLVQGRPARVLRVDDSFALLAVLGVTGPVATIPPDWSAAHPVDGARLTHRWFDSRSGTIRERTVTWRLSELVEGFESGMSGSGIHDATGSLVAVAEWTTGFAWTTLDLTAFIGDPLQGSTSPAASDIR